ncbi:hypothetical protein LSH36_755g00015 [Paralvinella palmiformis]|uniref:Apple domain-containing protein n=1 Tax=Paralvinella palmiformis TaxID=53620 RepID=A0AAD9MSS5_9ANNE|nr:hypothetical protein LSH36_755g00015 [Paralvinella palmiformis]
MSFLDGILFFFIVPWTPIVGGQRVNTRLSPVKNRPPDNDQIFDIQTPTDSQCIYNCIQNGKCLAVVYDKRRYLCNGYRSITANQSLTQEQQAWHIIYKATLVAIMNVVVRMMEYWNQVKGPCDGSHYYLDCATQKRFTQTNFSTPIVTNWLRITSFQFCSPDKGKRFGLIEVRLVGQFKRN